MSPISDTERSPESTIFITYPSGPIMKEKRYSQPPLFTNFSASPSLLSHSCIRSWVYVAGDFSVTEFDNSLLHRVYELGIVSGDYNGFPLLS